MSARWRLQAVQPAAVGRADLLRFFQHEADAQLRAQATALLGLPPLPSALFERPPPPPPPQPPPPPPPASAAAKLPLRCPELLHARPLPAEDAAAQADSENSTTKTARWTTADADEVENMLLAPGLAAPLQSPLVPFARRAGQVALARRLPSVPALDWPALLRQVAHGRLLWPLPLKRQQRMAPRLVLLLDVSPALGCFEEDFWGVALALGVAQGWRRTEVWLLPDGPGGRRVAAWEDMSQRAWDPQTVLVLLSDLGAGRPEIESRWQQQLRELRRDCGRLVAITPCARHLLAADVRRHAAVVPLVSDVIPAAQPLDEQRRSLLAALAPALSVEPSLIRAMRLALLPGSSPLLERDVWLHPDLVGGLPFRQWLPQRQRQWLEAGSPFDAERLLQVQKVMHQQHAHCNQVQRDEEDMLLASCALVAQQADGDQRLGPFLQQAAAAQARCARVARHLLHLQRQVPPSGNAVRARPAHSAGSKAEERLRRMPVHMRKLGDVGADELFAAQMLAHQLAGEQLVEVPPGVRWLEEAADAPPPKTLVALWQQGPDVWLRSADEGHAMDRVGVCLLTFELQGNWIEVVSGGSNRLLAVGSDHLPLKLLAAAAARTAPAQLRWPAGGIELVSVLRPRGAAAWALENGEVATSLAWPDGSLFSVRGGEAKTDVSGVAAYRWVPREAEDHAATSELMLRLESSPVDCAVGFDDQGAYLDLRRNRQPSVEQSPMLGPPLQRFRYIEPGTFLMGSPANEAGRSEDEGPQHPVTISQGYWLADTPCTQALWMAVMDGQNPSQFKDGAEAGQRPVDSVRWDDAQEFLKRLRALLPAGSQPELPTEAEWEYAARAGSDTAYAWGDVFDMQRANTRESSTGAPSVVKRYASNAWGLYDMHGNVWEWCADAPRSYRDQAELDPSGGTEGDPRVLRGGSWDFAADGARSACRNHAHRGSSWQDFGFRLALRSPSPVPGGPGFQGPGGPAVLAGRRQARAKKPPAHKPTPKKQS